MRNTKFGILILIILSLSCMLAAKETAKARRARENLKMYDIPFTVEAFISYVQRGNTEVVQRFVDAGFDVNTPNQNGDRALIFAAEKNLAAIMDILIKGGADVNAADADNSTALMYAAYYRNFDAVQMLVRRGANPNLKNNSKMTALMYGIHGGCINCINAIITPETDLEEKNINDKTALDLANELGYGEVANYLIEKQKYFTGTRSFERTPVEAPIINLGDK